MKILIITPTLDLKKPFTGTPIVTQLFKGFYEEGHEILIIPYSGKPIPSLWWRSYPNPNYYKSLLMEKIIGRNKFSSKKKTVPLVPVLARMLAKPNLEKLIKKILIKEKNIDAIIFITIPLNQINGLATEIKKIKNIPIIYYDLDIPSSLPSHNGFSFQYLKGADLSEFDSFVIISEGSISEVEELGAKNVKTIHCGVDPEICSPMNIEKDIDFFFLGTGGVTREQNMRMMVTNPSKVLSNKFVVSGPLDDIDVGNAIRMPMFLFPDWRKYCNRSKINLNIVREINATTESSSTARPFELASMGSCIVSAPYKGLDKWFDIGKEIIVVNSEKDCIDVYNSLLNDNELRLKMGIAARNRVKKEHTSRHRVREFIKIIKDNQ